MSAKTLATRRSDQQSTRRPGSAAHAPSLLATVDDVGNQSLHKKIINTNQKVAPVVPVVLLVLLVSKFELDQHFQRQQKRNIRRNLETRTWENEVSSLSHIWELEIDFQMKALEKSIHLFNDIFFLPIH